MQGAPQKIQKICASGDVEDDLSEDDLDSDNDVAEVTSSSQKINDIGIEVMQKLCDAFAKKVCNGTGYKESAIVEE